MRTQWETNGGDAFINPACCQTTNNYLLWPIYIAGIFTILMIAAAIAAIAYNIYLADKNEYLEFQKKVSIWPALIFAALILACLIAFLFYCLFRPAHAVPRTNPNNPDVIYSKYTKNVQGFQDSNFQVVDLNKVYGGKVPYTAYMQSDPYSTVSTQSGNVISDQ